MGGPSGKRERTEQIKVQEGHITLRIFEKVTWKPTILNISIYIFTQRETDTHTCLYLYTEFN